MRLVRLLIEHAPAATSATYALAALMWLHAVRLPGRTDEAGNLKDLFEQDRAKWDVRLIEEGMALLGASAGGAELTEYHAEAGIAALHAAAGRAEDTRWRDVVSLYDVLMKLRPSPVVALSRAIAIGERDGPAQGLVAIRAIESVDRLSRYPFYPAALGELELRNGEMGVAVTHFRAAERLARNDGERRFLEQRIAACGRAAHHDSR